MTAQERRNKVKSLYETILGRNSYSQDALKRQCVFDAYKDGKFYSDCSSSILNTLCEADIIGSRYGNTETIHNTGLDAHIQITDGIPAENDLRIGDCLMFRGTDASRPMQIGHVEMYAGNGILYGHGSGTPSKKNMVEYCKNRWSQKAPNGKNKGLVEVRRYIIDDAVKVPIEANLCITAALNCRTAPVTGEVIGTFQKGEHVIADMKCDHWFHVVGKGWCSANYLTGWVREDHGWWYLLPNYTWYASCVKTIEGQEYVFDRDGWMITSDRIGSSGAIKY